MKRKSSLIVLPLAFALLVSGSPQDVIAAVSPPPAKVQPPAPPAKTAPPAPSVKALPSPPSSPVKQKQSPTADYHYNPAGKPDPFLPFVDKELALKKKVEKAAAVTSIFPLQRVSVEQFNLVGIAGNTKRRLAIVETKGKFYPIAVGTIIGLNKGRVVEIRSDRVVVSEVSSGGKGRKVNNINMKLHKGEDEGTP